MTTGAAPRLSVDRLRAALGTKPPTVAPPPRRRHAALESMYPGREIETDLGACFMAEWIFPLNYRHGYEPLAGACALDDRGAACIARDANYTAPQQPVFFDTETTGLSGGTGTYAFLIGLGTIESDRVVVRQYVMRDYDEELALLEAVGSQLVQHDAVVTYNGKSFDVPLIETRFIASRHPGGVFPPAHLDLLYPTRRLLRGRLDRCALNEVERAVLGFCRFEDIPSWMIPSVYFQFVREGDARLLGGVLEHNRDDILSLMALTGWLARTYQSSPGPSDDARLLIRVARTHASIGWLDDAMRILAHVVDSTEPGDWRAEAAMDLARLRRSAGLGHEAEPMWDVAAGHSMLGIEALIAWAKYLEHERRDFERARQIVERALTWSELRARLAGVHYLDPLRQSLEHRLARIVRRSRREHLGGNV
jgi:uncharacterized protein